MAKKGKEDVIATKSLVPGESVYGEKKIAVETDSIKTEYRVWNPFRSKIAAAVLGGCENIHMPPGSKVLSSGTSRVLSSSRVLSYAYTYA